MNCPGCFICCDDINRHKYAKIKKIEIVGAMKEFDGIYILQNLIYNGKPTYTKQNDDIIELFWHSKKHWLIAMLNKKKFICQKINCPIFTWTEKNNLKNSKWFLTIETPFDVVDPSNVSLKPAK